MPQFPLLCSAALIAAGAAHANQPAPATFFCAISNASISYEGTEHWQQLTDAQRRPEPVRIPEEDTSGMIHAAFSQDGRFYTYVRQGESNGIPHVTNGVFDRQENALRTSTSRLLTDDKGRITAYAASYTWACVPQE